MYFSYLNSDHAFLCKQVQQFYFQDRLSHGSWKLKMEKTSYTNPWYHRWSVSSGSRLGLQISSLICAGKFYQETERQASVCFHGLTITYKWIQSIPQNLFLLVT